MGHTDGWRDPRITVTGRTGVDEIVLAHIADRLGGIDRFSRWPLFGVRVVARHKPVANYGSVVCLEARVDLPIGVVEETVEADVVFTAADKLRDRLFLRLAECDVRGEPRRGLWNRIWTARPHPQRDPSPLDDWFDISHARLRPPDEERQRRDNGPPASPGVP